MKILKKYIVNETQRGLLFKNQQFERVLAPGVYRIWDWHNEYQLQAYSLQNNLQEGVPREVQSLAQLHEQAFAPYLEFWQTGEQEVGLVYQQDALREIKAPGQFGAYWKTHQPIRVVTRDISTEFSVEAKMLPVLSGAREPLLGRSATAAVTVTSVGDSHVGFLLVDGKTLGTVAPGLHMWWKFNRVIEAKQFDLRFQN